MIYLYNTFLIVVAIFLSPILIFKIFSDKNLKIRLKERLLFLPKNFKELIKKEKIIWLHASSVGEVNVTSLIINKLRNNFPEHKFLITTMTVTGYEYAAKMKKFDFILPLPFDLPFIIKKFYKFINPDIILIAETEFWPNIFYYTKKFNIPLIVFNCRISDKSIDTYLKFKFFFKDILNCASLFLCQNEITAERLYKIGVVKEKVKLTKNIKFDLNFNINQNEIFKEFSIEKWHGSKIITAGSTHKGEEEVLINIFIKLQSKIKNLKLIIAPRHPERSIEVGEILNKNNISYKFLSEKSNNIYDVLVIDQIGVLVKSYSISDICFVGGSLILRGGHNPLEAIYFRKPVISGRNIFNFKEIYSLLEKNEGIVMVSTEYELEREIEKLLKYSDYSKRVAENGYKILQENRGSIDKTIDLVVKTYQSYR